MLIANDHLGTPREMFDQSGRLTWSASYSTWGAVRGIKTAAPANDEGGQAIYPRDGGGGTRGNLALALVSDKAQYDCPIRFQGQWEDEDTGLNYNRARHYDCLSNQ